jgi:ribosomal protein S18 acetylase RimI-like enzyme
MEKEQPKSIKPITPERLKLRPVNTADQAFLLEVYASGREMELALLPWDETQKQAFVEHQLQAQTRHYETEYPTARHDIILLDSLAVGRIYVLRDAQEISILDIGVLPVHRNQGIATALVKQLQNEAAQTGKSIKIYVEPYNPSQNLFRNLGFEVNDDDGLNLLFEWKPGN